MLSSEQSVYGKGSDRVCLNKVKGDTVTLGWNSSPILNTSADDSGIAGAMVESPSGNRDLHLEFCSGCWPDGVEKHGMLDCCPSLGLCLNGEKKGGATLPIGSTDLHHFRGCCTQGYGCYTVGGRIGYDEGRAMNQKLRVVMKRYCNGDVYESWRRGALVPVHWRRVLMRGESMWKWARSLQYGRKLASGLRQNKGAFNISNGYRHQTAIHRSKDGVTIELVDGKCTCVCPKCSEPLLNVSCCSFEDGVGFSKFCGLEAETPFESYRDEFLSSKLTEFWPAGDHKRLGEVIHEGHRSYKLVRILQLGIRYYMGQNAEPLKQELSALDFRKSASTQIRIPAEGFRHCSETWSNFRWKDYCPAVFRHLQELDKIDASDYMLSVCGNETLRELTSAGKSGSLLYLSQDDRFVIKTIRKSEMKVLLEMLPKYYNYVQEHTSTLLTKFYGLHLVKPSGGHKVHFVVMGNIFHSDLRIHRRFDLKGSSQGRCVSEEGINGSTTFKDLDLDVAFYLNPSMCEQLLMQIELDCNFLEAEGIMDYSLLLGVHIPSASSYVSPNKGLVSGKTLLRRASSPDKSLLNYTNQEMNSCSDLPLACPEWPGHELGEKVPVHAVRKAKVKKRSTSLHKKEMTGEAYDAQLYLGIIDILQGYNVRKRMEHAYKSLQFDSQSISAVNPKLYSKRFQDFLSKVFLAQELGAKGISLG